MEDVDEVTDLPEEQWPTLKDFKIGDRVRIVRKIPTHYVGSDGVEWANAWVSSMTFRLAAAESIDVIETIERITSAGIYFVGSDLGWPPQALEKVEFEQLDLPFLIQLKPPQLRQVAIAKTGDITVSRWQYVTAA